MSLNKYLPQPTHFLFYSQLILGNNPLSNTLQGWIGTEMKKLQYVDFSRTYFEGTLPTTWIMLSIMKIMRLNDNNLITGTIPSEWSNMKKIVGLHLYNTTVTGSASFLCNKYLTSKLLVDLDEVECKCCAQP